VNFWCETVVTPAGVLHGARIVAGAVLPGPAQPDDVLLGTVVPGAANAHSHAFHRILRGRTHSEGGTFWQWRERMYAAAATLDPEHYERLATAVFAEMLVNGWTAVGEFHYLHHLAGAEEHAMELALARAALATGIRLTLLDTAYLAGGFGLPLAPEQWAFGDEGADAYLRRWHDLRERLPEGVLLGAALHSVRAVPADAMRTIVAGLPETVPLHVHVSEQPQENADCRAAHGVTPIRLLADLGVLAARTSLVHATHASPEDVALVAASGATVVMCPTTEADLGDGVGPARAFADAGVPIAIGSDQNAVVDPFLELRGLEAGERLASGRRGRFDPSELLACSGQAGYSALGLLTGDFVELDAASIRTVGSRAEQLVLSATGADVRRVIVGGRVVVEHGRVRGLAAPEELLREAMA
jgi:formiminoglutamate deiminase